MGRTSAPLRCELGLYQLLNTVHDEAGFRTYVWTDFEINPETRLTFNRAARDVAGVQGVRDTDKTYGVSLAIFFDDNVNPDSVAEKTQLLFERFNARLGIPPTPAEQIELAMAVFPDSRQRERMNERWDLHHRG